MVFHPPEFYWDEGEGEPPTWRGSCVVRPKVAFKLLNVSTTRGYELVNSGELESYRDGPTRQITVRSIRRYLAHQLVTGGSRPLRRLGGPRKQDEGEAA